jgi:hypothetical protein
MWKHKIAKVIQFRDYIIVHLAVWNDVDGTYESLRNVPGKILVETINVKDGVVVNSEGQPINSDGQPILGEGQPIQFNDELVASRAMALRDSASIPADSALFESLLEQVGDEVEM